ncbi:hypothetical protein BK127_40930 [Paenibacillus sp. FSL H7-0331]|nr:hypothetical protein BK127_40930 [Paenibacillus sp. FSL H7-0331]
MISSVINNIEGNIANKYLSKAVTFNILSLFHFGNILKKILLQSRQKYKWGSIKGNRAINESSLTLPIKNKKVKNIYVDNNNLVKIEVVCFTLSLLQVGQVLMPSLQPFPDDFALHCQLHIQI